MRTKHAEDFISLRDQLKAYVPVFEQAASVIEDEGVSKYPIMIVHKQQIELGIPLEMGNSLGEWAVHASTLEEFVARNLIQDDKLDDFRELYRRHENHVCLFVLSQLGAQFIFFEKR